VPGMWLCGSTLCGSGLVSQEEELHQNWQHTGPPLAALLRLCSLSHLQANRHVSHRKGVWLLPVPVLSRWLWLGGGGELHERSTRCSSGPG
jgi:hypothetical protein